jgi:hypothetical protein
VSRCVPRKEEKLNETDAILSALEERAQQPP